MTCLYLQGWAELDELEATSKSSRRSKDRKIAKLDFSRQRTLLTSCLMLRRQ